MAKRFQQGNIVSDTAPVGTVKAYVGAVAPNGWLLCNGDPYPRTTYVALFALIGTTYDTQINESTGLAFTAPAGTHFRVPDYRMLFLRGVGSVAGLDPVTMGGRQVDKTKKNGLTATVSGSNSASSAPVTGTNAASSVSINTNLVTSWNSGQSATHGAQSTINYNGSLITGSGSADAQAWTQSAGTANAQPWSGTATVGAGDTETRPLNKGVNYIIKY